MFTVGAIRKESWISVPTLIWFFLDAPKQVGRCRVGHLRFVRLPGNYG